MVIKKDPMYKFFKNVIIKGDRRFPADLYTPADITECTVVRCVTSDKGPSTTRLGTCRVTNLDLCKKGK